MNVPAIAKKSFDQLKHHAEFISIVQAVLEKLKTITQGYQRARTVHQLVDFFNKETFAHPLVQKLSPCQKGCHACCHTQISVTEDEAELLVLKIKNEQLKLNLDRLEQQMTAKNDADQYFKLPFQTRRCIFLDDSGACQVYEDRPSVCRTNAVLGSKEQCDTTNGQTQVTRLVSTPQSDMAIYASFLFASSSGTLPYMIGKRLKEERRKEMETL